MALEFVKPKEQPDVNVLLYGPPKSGKSTGAAGAPGPVLYVNADKGNALHFARTRHPELLEVKFTGLRVLQDVINEVTKSPGDWGTVVLDPVGNVYDRLVDEQSGNALNPAIDLYKNAGTHIKRWCGAMVDAEVNFVIVCHDFPVKDESTGTVERMPYTGSASNPSLANRLMGMADVIGYCGRVEQEGDDEALYMAQLIDANGRRGGERFGGLLGKSRELNLSEWFDTIAQQKKDVAKNAKKDDKKTDAPKAQEEAKTK